MLISILVTIFLCLSVGTASADYILPPTGPNKARGVDGCTQTSSEIDCSRRYGGSSGPNNIYVHGPRGPSAQQVARYLEARRLIAKAYPFSLEDLPAERSFSDTASLHQAVDRLLDIAQEKLAYLSRLSWKAWALAETLEQSSQNQADIISSLQQNISRLRKAISYLEEQTHKASSESSRLKEQLSRNLDRLQRIEAENQVTQKKVFALLATAAEHGLILSPSNYRPKPTAPEPVYVSQVITGPRFTTPALGYPRFVTPALPYPRHVTQALPPPASAIVSERRDPGKQRKGTLKEKLGQAEQLARMTRQAAAQYKANTSRARRAQQGASHVSQRVARLSSERNRLSLQKIQIERVYSASIGKLRRLKQRLKKSRIALPLEAARWAFLKIYQDYLADQLSKILGGRVAAQARAKLIKIGASMIRLEADIMGAAAEAVPVLVSPGGNIEPIERRLEEAKRRFAIDFYAVFADLPQWIVQLLPKKEAGE